MDALAMPTINMQDNITIWATLLGIWSLLVSMLKNIAWIMEKIRKFLFILVVKDIMRKVPMIVPIIVTLSINPS